MHHVIYHVHRILVSRRPGGLKATSLVDGHVDHHRSRLHVLQHIPGNELWSFGTRNKHRPNDQVTCFDEFANVELIGVHRHHIGWHDICQVTEPG